MDKGMFLANVERTIEKYDNNKYAGLVKIINFDSDLFNGGAQVDVDVVVDVNSQEDKRVIGALLQDLKNKYSSIINVNFHQYGLKQYSELYKNKL